MLVLTILMLPVWPAFLPPSACGRTSQSTASSARPLGNTDQLAIWSRNAVVGWTYSHGWIYGCVTPPCSLELDLCLSHCVLSIDGVSHTATNSLTHSPGIQSRKIIQRGLLGVAESLQSNSEVALVNVKGMPGLLFNNGLNPHQG